MNEGRTKVNKGREDHRFFLGSVDKPYAVLTNGEIPDYLDDEFFSAYQIWNYTRLTGTLPFANMGWAETPQYLIEIITAFQLAYEHTRPIR